MNSDSELVVIEAAGAKPATVLRPVLALSVALSIMVLLVANFVEPWSNRKLYDVLARAQSDLFSVAVRSGTFMKLEDGLYVQVNEKLPRRRFERHFSVRYTDRRHEAIYYAKSGVVRPQGETNILLLLDGELQQKDHDQQPDLDRDFLVLRPGHGGIRACRKERGAAAQGAVDALSAQPRAGRFLFPEGSVRHNGRAGPAFSARGSTRSPSG
jgi:lipopolysaccharide export LptBFGC system permease protein LptF